MFHVEHRGSRHSSLDGPAQLSGEPRDGDCSTWNILPLPLTVASRRYRHMTPRKVVDGQGCAEGARYLSLGRSPRTPAPIIPCGLKARAKITRKTISTSNPMG